MTVVYRIEDPIAFRKTSPLSYEHDGVKAIGCSIGDLMAYSDALEELIDDEKEEEKDAAFRKHCPMPE